MDNRLWAFVFTGLMIVTIVLELLTPSMGGFTIAGLALAGAAIWMGFRHSDSFGYLMVGIELLLVPLTLWFSIKALRHSPLIHHATIAAETQDAPDALPLTALVGQQGRAITPLRPGGSVLIGTAKVDVVTEGKWVDANALVKVLRVEGNRVVVEPVA